MEEDSSLGKFVVVEEIVYIVSLASGTGADILAALELWHLVEQDESVVQTFT